MMPSAQPITMLTPPSTKPKIGFSIDSIVGNRMRTSSISEDYHEDSHSNDGSNENLPKLSSSPSDLRRNYSHLIKRSREHLSPSPPTSTEHENEKRISRISESSDQDVQNNNNNVPLKSTQPITQKGPIMVPGIPAQFMHNRSQIISPSNGPPAYSHDIPPGHPHFLQFQAAAALVHAQASQTGFSGTLPQHLPPLHNHPSIARDSYPLYPWLLSRHGRIFPHRFPGSKLKTLYFSPQNSFIFYETLLPSFLFEQH